MTTPDFPDWAGGFGHQLRKLCSTAAPTLHQLELLFATWIPHWRLAQEDEGPIRGIAVGTCAWFFGPFFGR